MARPKGSRTVLIRITYDTIGELAGGIPADVAKRHAQRGQFDSRNLESTLLWVNERRRRRGLSPIGLLTETDQDVSADGQDAGISIPTPLGAGLLTYDPMTGGYRV